MSGNTVLKKVVKVITGQHCNVNLRSNTNHIIATPTTSSVFSTKQILSRSVHKTERSLLSSPRKKAEVIGTLAKKFNLRVAVHNKSGRKKNELSEEKEEWIENFLERSDITYTTPGKMDTVYVGTYGGKRKYKQ